jgi:hypothetical protein
MSELVGPARSTAIVPGSSKNAHGLVPSLSDGIARKIIEMSAPIAIAMISLAFMVHPSLAKLTAFDAPSGKREIP